MVRQRTVALLVAAPESDELIEYVPLSDAVARRAGVVACGKQTGPYQRQGDYVYAWGRRAGT
ncbi:hypothetical protein [Streptomyces sp. NBC_00878]|uniref:hypothetical protein n=1 Tax=Streptomyces sp. NBC_00878 TaxID=2975854 RepID=UPI00224CE53E|nr:hypothetical protein [Streptomyces sp. NBC_00878]MCX4908156.1 hypothetical protein [Streptomyces sp. NBC_00878]